MSEQSADTEATREEGPRLHLLNGHPAPPVMIEGWQAFLDFPDAARDGIWPLLAGVLIEPSDPENEDRFEAFIERHGGSPEGTAQAIKTLVEMLRQAAIIDLSAKAFEADLIALSGDRPGHKVILARYEPALTELRLAILQGSLADHGKLLTNVDWRVDRMSESGRGAALNAPVLLLTLGYREGRKTDRITLQLLPDAVQRLKTILNRFSD
jgi:hypothetical protein